MLLVCRSVVSLLALLVAYTKAKDSGFVANPGCFDIVFILPFTLSNMNSIQNYHR